MFPFEKNDQRESNLQESSDNAAPEILSGCATMEKLWEAAQACYLTEPGISGTPARTANFVTCKNIFPFMRTAALKCWEERTRESAGNPYMLFTPFDVMGEVKKRKGEKSAKSEGQESRNVDNRGSSSSHR